MIFLAYLASSIPPHLPQSRLPHGHLPDDLTPMPAPAARNRVSGTTPDALSVLNSVFGLPGFRGQQEEIVRHVTQGGNCLVLMPTGGGKSLCYQLPALLRKG